MRVSLSRTLKPGNYLSHRPPKLFCVAKRGEEQQYYPLEGSPVRVRDSRPKTRRNIDSRQAKCVECVGSRAYHRVLIEKSNV